ncbi:hypothetical protein TrLO_g11815 [Triparma laevis f. longispina]|uniref:Uncharacterized protein n=1 Tax=Triparma laevis f. longispina TaxID=1714387 RepID=A0A9W7F9V2_9STRA|nr:hypothetical protein TrLO_g11815 [Triparma laevis f. longispina]
MPSSNTIKVQPNTRNLVLNGPTIRATSLAQSLTRPVPEVDESLFSFSPSVPKFGCLASNCVYHLPVLVRTCGADVARLRLKPPVGIDKYGNVIDKPSENSPTLQIKVSSTRLIPGLHEQLTLVLQTTSEGPFKFSFTIIGELQTYKLTVTGHVLPPDGFHALAALAKLEGRSGLEPGVRFVSELNVPSGSLAPPPAPDYPDYDAETPADNSKSDGEKTGGGEERDTIEGLYDPNNLDLEDVGSFPSLTGIYWDKNTNSMALHKPTNSHVIIDGSKSLEEVVEENDRRVNEMQQNLEIHGHLTARCLESLRQDGRIPRDLFRTLSVSMNS